MTIRTKLILAGALIVAGGVLFTFYQDTYIVEETGGPRVLVVAATRDIPFGEPVQGAWLTTKELPARYVEERHLRAASLRSLIGLPLARSVRSGEAVLRTDLSSQSGQQRALSTDIPTGRRATPIRIRGTSSLPHLLKPGDRVDAVLVATDASSRALKRSVVIAQHLLILSVGQTLRDSDDETSGQQTNPSRGTLVNVECDLEEAQRLALAERQGRVRLVLRNPNDASRVEDAPDLRTATLLDRGRRASWLRRFGLASATADEGQPGAIEP